MIKKINKFIATIALCSCFGLVTQPSVVYGINDDEIDKVEYIEETSINGWVEENGDYYYYLNNEKQNGWVKDGKRWYWLKSDGKMASNEWLNINQKWYRFHTGGGMFENEWYQDLNGDWYWLKSGGQMASDEILIINNKEYKFKTSGKMYTEEELKAEKIVELAYKQIGKPYSWGSTGPNSFDCSGLTSYVYKNSVNIKLPRTSKEQSKYGQTVSKSELQSGDLVFFGSGKTVSHVGIYIGDSKMIHSPSPGQTVRVEKINSTYYSNRLITAKRVL